MSDIAKAWAIGKWPKDDPIVREARSVAHAHLVEFEETSVARALPKLDQQSLVLLRHGLDVAPGTLEQLLATPARLVVFVPEGAVEVAATTAVKLCLRNVITVVAWRDGLPGSFRGRLERLHAGQPLYSEIRLPPNQGRARVERAFVAHPFTHEGERFFNAVSAALTARGVRIQNPRGFNASGSLSEKIRGLIQDSDFVVADTRILDGGANKNVWLEVGVALGQEKHTILSVMATDRPSDAIASDLYGVEFLKYWDALDLTMKLYWGLHWLQNPT